MRLIASREADVTPDTSWFLDGIIRNEPKWFTERLSLIWRDANFGRGAHNCEDLIHSSCTERKQFLNDMTFLVIESHEYPNFYVAIISTSKRN
jgi:hypothetical protein